MSREQLSKSKRIQEYLRGHPDDRNRDVVNALSEFGVTAADVSNAKAQLKRKTIRRRSRTAVVAATLPDGAVVPAEETRISLSEIEATIDYVQAVGGLIRAQQLLSIVQQIQQI
ncbi:MAG: hypothetical protein KF752_02405 [Pirellulaceae bacterium]|nr:hypothetical protein [Pirellulaceae bacterium]